MENIQHRTSNFEHLTARCARARKNWMLDVRCWMVGVVFWLSLLAPFSLRAQTPPQLPPGGLSQLQVAQPAVDVSSPVTATAEFDPPVVRAGEKTFYRVTVEATESSIQWPEEISAPAELKFGANARGQLTQFLGNKFRPLTSFVYEVRPAAAGHFTITNFTVNISASRWKFRRRAWTWSRKIPIRRRRRGSWCWKLRRRMFFSASRSACA